MDMKTSPLTALGDAGLLKTHGLINGERVAGHGRFDVLDPATRLRLADVANLDAAAAEAAIDATSRAWPLWRAKPRRNAARS